MSKIADRDEWPGWDSKERSWIGTLERRYRYLDIELATAKRDHRGTSFIEAEMGALKWALTELRIWGKSR